MSLTTSVVKYDFLFSFISNNFAAACHSVLKLLQLSSNWFTELFSKLRKVAQFFSTLLFHTTRLAMLICRCVVELFDTCRVHHTSVARIKQQWPIEMFIMFIQNKLQLCIQLWTESHRALKKWSLYWRNQHLFLNSQHLTLHFSVTQLRVQSTRTQYGAVVLPVPHIFD